MAKFQNKHSSDYASQPAVTPPPVSAPVTENTPVLIQKDNAALGGDLKNILSDDIKVEDTDKPNTKYQDQDFSRNDFFMGGRRIVQTDALARALNADCYLLDVPKAWGMNPLGGRPINVYFTREFPGKNILYDHIELSPETSTLEKVSKVVAFKAKLANDHGYVYLYQHNWTTLTTDELDRQLQVQKDVLKKK